MAAHPAVEEQALDAALDQRDRPLDPVVADAGEQRVERNHRPLEAPVDPFEVAGVADHKEPDSVHSPSHCPAVRVRQSKPEAVAW